ncbi:MAG: helix-hairpin-helix domain-containing protein [Alistipes sp.]|nr:helix-hairpin-helix domain-containing protein [Alistipes sp.]
MKNWFNEQEIRGLLLFLPLAALAIAALMLVQPHRYPDEARRVEQEAADRPFVPKPFDPNEVSYREMRAMGFTAEQANALIAYRQNGPIRIPSKLAQLHGFGDSVFYLIEEYIRIGEEYRRPKRSFEQTGRYRSKPQREPLPLELFLLDTAGVRYLAATGLFTGKQAEYLVRQHKKEPFYDIEALADYFVVGDSVAALLEPYVIFPEKRADPYDQPVELNRADSAELVRVWGIGELTAGRIVAYRERLGGFVRVEQLAEVPGVTDRNYERILKQIYCDPCEIQKIDINFADAKKLERHPYIGPKAIRKITKIKQLKGGWSTAEEMVEDDIFTREEAERIAPYLEFRPAE